MKWFAAFLVACLIGGVSSAHAQSITKQRWDVFVEESYGQYGDSSPDDWEDILYAAYEATKIENADTRSAAISEFGRRIETDPVTAQSYADVIVEAVAFREANRDKPSVPTAFVPGQRLYDLTRAIAMNEPEGRLLFVVGTVVDKSPEAFIRLAKSHPKASSVFLALNTYGTKGPYLLAALQDLPADASGMAPPVMWPEWSDVTVNSEAQTLAAIEAAYNKLVKTPETRAWRAGLSRYLIQSYLLTGLNSEGVALYRVNAEELLPLWLEMPEGDQYVMEAARDGLARNMAAALWAEGEADTALALLDRAFPPGNLKSDIVRDAIRPAIADADLFDHHLLGRACVKGAKDCEQGRETIAGLTVWTPPVMRDLLSRRLAAAGYADMARDLSVLDRYNFRGYKAVGYERIDDLLPEGAVPLVPAWTARILAYNVRSRATVEAKGDVYVTVTPLPSQWSERPLPEGIAPWLDTDKAGKLPGKSQLPVSPESVVRYERDGKDAALIYQSSRYDLPGEVPAYGLWLTLRRGGQWKPPVYLGLQQYFPYVATEGSHLPLIRNDRLQLEVRVKEIDPGTITFPPVGLGFARQAEGLYLDIALSDLMADADGDGLTDIEEARLGLKTNARDSDGDGVEDRRDPLPLTAYRPETDQITNTVARTILEKLTGHDSGAIMIAPRQKADASTLEDILSAIGGGPSLTASNALFVVGDPELFSGIISAPMQVIVYSPADLEVLGRDEGVFYPPHLIRLYPSLDRKRWYVMWSASWVGGSFLIDCSQGDCKTEDLAGWIS